MYMHKKECPFVLCVSCFSFLPNIIDKRQKNSYSFANKGQMIWAFKTKTSRWKAQITLVERSRPGLDRRDGSRGHKKATLLAFWRAWQTKREWLKISWAESLRASWQAVADSERLSVVLKFCELYHFKTFKSSY